MIDISGFILFLFFAPIAICYLALMWRALLCIIKGDW